MRLIVQGLISSLILIVVAYIVPGVSIDTFLTAVAVFLVFMVVNVFLKPVIKLITLPINIITLGIFGLIVNVFLFWFIGWLVPGFTIDNFWSATVGLVLFTLMQSLIYGFD